LVRIWIAIKRFIRKTKDLYHLRADVETLKKGWLIHAAKLNYLMDNEPRHVRRKWKRMQENTSSPFYIGLNITEQRIYSEFVTSVGNREVSPVHEEHIEYVRTAAKTFLSVFEILMDVNRPVSIDAILKETARIYAIKKAMKQETDGMAG